MRLRGVGGHPRLSHNCQARASGRPGRARPLVGPRLPRANVLPVQAVCQPHDPGSPAFVSHLAKSSHELLELEVSSLV